MTKNIISDEEINNGLRQLIDAQLNTGAIDDDLFFYTLIAFKKEGIKTVRSKQLVEKYNSLVDFKNKKDDKVFYEPTNQFVIGHILSNCTSYFLEPLSDDPCRSPVYQIGENIEYYRESLPRFMNETYRGIMVSFFDNVFDDGKVYGVIKKFLNELNTEFEHKYKKNEYKKNSNKAIISKSSISKKFEADGCDLSDYGMDIDGLFSTLVNNKIISHDGRSYSTHSKQRSLLNGLLTYVQNNRLVDKTS